MTWLARAWSLFVMPCTREMTWFHIRVNLCHRSGLRGNLMYACVLVFRHFVCLLVYLDLSVGVLNKCLYLITVLLLTWLVSAIIITLLSCWLIIYFFISLFTTTTKYLCMHQLTIASAIDIQLMIIPYKKTKHIIYTIALKWHF